MTTTNIYALLSDPQGRQELIDALNRAAQQNPQDEVLPYLSQALDQGHYFLPLSPEQERILSQVIAASDISVSHNTAVRFASEAPPLYSNPAIEFVVREGRDTLRQFLDKNLAAFGLGKDVPRDQRSQLIESFYLQTGIRWGSAKKWGEEEGNHIVEPRDLNQVLKVYTWLDGQSRTHGKRVDFWDFLACIYPRVSKMIARSDAQGQIIVRVPTFMENIPYENFSYETFAMAAKNANLVEGVPDSTVYGHASSRVERPAWESLERYATLIAEQAINDTDDINHRQQVFDFLVLLRLFPVIGHIVPVRDIADRPITKDSSGHLITAPLNNFPTRFTLRVVPQLEIVEYMSFGEAALFNVRYWPFSGIASGLFDRMLDIVDHRITAFEKFSYALENQETEIQKLRAKFQELLGQHLLYKTNIENPEADSAVRTQEYLNAIKTFYRELDQFFRKTLFFTHARGSVTAGDLEINFEIVPQVSGVEISPVAHGRVSVFADDLIGEAQEHNWSDEEIKNVFLLRVLTAWQVASGVAPEIILQDPQEIQNLVQKFDLGLSETDLHKYAAVLAALNQAAKQQAGTAIDPALHRAIHLRTTGTTRLQPYYLYDHSLPWREQLTAYYQAQGYPEINVEFDAHAAEQYFQAVRHPHYIYDPEKLEAAVADTYPEAEEQIQAKQRLLGFFRQINVLTDPVSVHPLSADDTAAEAKVIDWAFQDYLANFPGADELGAHIEINEKLLSEIVDRQLALHPDVPLRRRLIRRGLIEAIGKLNENRTQTVEQITQNLYPLPSEGIFPQRFFAFVDRWSLDRHATLLFKDQEVRDKLLLAFSIIKDSGRSFRAIDEALAQVGLDDEFESDYGRLMISWMANLHNEMELFEKLTNPEMVRAYLNNRYRAPLISADLASKLLLEYLKRRLTTPQPVNMDALIISELGDRFDPYPAIKAEVVAFYHTFIREYLHHLHAKLRQRYEEAVDIIDMVAEDYIIDPTQVMRGSTSQSFDTQVLNQLGFIHPRHSDFISLLTGSANPELIITAQYHPSFEDLNNFEHQVRIVAEAIGEPPPDTRLEDYMQAHWRQITTHIDQLYEGYQKKIQEQKGQLILAEKPVEDFWRRVQTSLAKYLESYDANNMGADEIETALHNINMGLGIVAGLKEEMEGEVLTAWGRASEIADLIAEDDTASDLMHRAEELITQTEKHLAEQQLLLEIRKEELEEQEMRTIADQEAIPLIEQAKGLLTQSEEISTEIKDLSTKINELRAEISSFAGLHTENTAQDLATYQDIWATLNSFRQRADELRRKLNHLRSDFEVLNPGTIQQKLSEIDSEKLSDAVRADRREARRQMVQAMSLCRTALEQAEGFITNLGRSLVKLEKQMTEKEKELPSPATLEMPAPSHYADELLITTPDGRKYVTFETSAFTAISSNKMRRALLAMQDMRVVAIGDKSYIVDGSTADRINNWLANRAGDLKLNDVFGEEINIAAGFHGVRILDFNSLPADHILRRLDKSFQLLLSQKSRETDFAIKLFESVHWDENAARLWQQLMIHMALQTTDSETDVRLAIRRFALAHYNEVGKIKALAKNNWFVENNLPLQASLTDDEYATIENQPLEKISSSYHSLQGAGNKAVAQLGVAELSDALKPWLSSPVLAWWTENEALVPHVLGILWRAVMPAHNKEALQTLLVHNLAMQLEKAYASNGRLSAADMSQTVRLGLKFLMEHLPEIRFGDILYKNGKLLYDLDKHSAAARIAQFLLANPQLVPLIMIYKEDDVRRGLFLVTHEERDRIMADQERGVAGRYVLTRLNWDTGELDEFPLAEFSENLFMDSPVAQYSRLFEAVFTDPRFLGLGFLIHRISDNTLSSFKYQSMLKLFAQYNTSLDEPDHVRIPKLLKLEAKLEEVYRRGTSSTQNGGGLNGIGTGGTNIPGLGSGILGRLGLSSARTAVPLPQLPVEIKGSLEDGTPVKATSEEIIGFIDAEQLAAASQQIEQHVGKHITGWADLDPETRSTHIRAMVNLAAQNPHEANITVETGGMMVFQASTGITALMTPPSFTIPNPFVSMLPMGTMPIIGR